MNTRDVFINKSVWSKFTEQEMIDYQELVFQFYRSHGFPYFPNDKPTRFTEYMKLMKYKGVPLKDGVLTQTMHGLSLAWSYMPHSWEVVCNDKLTPMEVFNDDDLLKKVIAKRIKIGDNMSHNGLRKMLKMYTGVQSVSNFRPTAAYALYTHFCEYGDTVLDMSSGFGGRILGAMKAKVKYIGYDPSVLAHEGVRKLAGDFKYDCQLFCDGSENINLPPNSVDFAFTSPPYFDTEKYSDDAGQSYLKYKTTNDWLNGFIKDTFTNVYSCLKDGKYMLINVANVPNYKTLEQDVIDMAISCGFVHEDTWQLALSKPPSKNKTGYKYEPVFVFKKIK
jgi:hypothetical protein